MKVFLHLREAVTPASFVATVIRQIGSGQTKSWEIVRRRPLTIRHKGRFKGAVTIKRALPGRTTSDHAPPDLSVIDKGGKP